MVRRLKYEDIIRIKQKAVMTMIIWTSHFNQNWGDKKRPKYVSISTLLHAAQHYGLSAHISDRNFVLAVSLL
jgi:hypothetical protein